MPHIDTAQYDQDGYAVARRIIPASLIAEVWRDLHEAAHQQLTQLAIALPRTGSDDIVATTARALAALHAADLDAYLATLRLCATLYSSWRMIVNDAMVTAARACHVTFPVLQTQPVLHVMSEDLRIKNGYFGVEAHQDWPALHSGLDTVTVWIPLMPVHTRGFTLEIYPGSHLLGFVDAEQGQHAHHVPATTLADLPRVSVELAAGDVLFFSAFLIHRSELNADEGAFRVAYSMRYENAADPYFIRHKYPHAHKRVVARELDPKSIPTKDEVRRTFRDPDK